MNKFEVDFKLNLRGDFHVWELRLKNHLQLLGLWNYVTDGDDIEDRDLFGSPWTAAQLAARAMRDILQSLDNDILRLVRSCETATEVYAFIKKLFLGTDDANKAKLRNDLYKWRFQGNWFTFLNGFQTRYQLLDNVDGVDSYKGIAFLLLNNLPREKFPMLLFTLTTEVEEAGEDVVEVYDNVYTKLLTFATRAGFYDKDQTERSQRRQNSSDSRRCYNCNKIGHIARYCPDKLEKTANVSADKNEKSDNIPQSFSALTVEKIEEKTDKNFENVEEIKVDFIVDSGATQHMTGNIKFLHSIEEIKPPLQVTTVNGAVFVSMKGTVLGKLENGRVFKLKDTLHVPNSPNLVSVDKLMDAGCNVLFSNKKCTVSFNEHQIFECQNKLTVITTLNKEKLVENGNINSKDQENVDESIVKAAYSASKIPNIWHFRLNHLPAERLVKITGIHKEGCLDKKNCKGCLLGSQQRMKINNILTNIYKLFEKWVGDSMGPFPWSFDGKRGISLITGVRSGLVFVVLVYESRAEIPKWTMEVFEHIERHHPGAKIFKADGALA